IVKSECGTAFWFLYGSVCDCVMVSVGVWGVWQIECVKVVRLSAFGGFGGCRCVSVGTLLCFGLCV
ncbi:Methionine Aminopeptidase 1D, partial [Manis pentadactyla]